MGATLRAALKPQELFHNMRELYPAIEVGNGSLTAAGATHRQGHPEGNDRCQQDHQPDRDHVSDSGKVRKEISPKSEKRDTPRNVEFPELLGPA